MLDTAGRLSIDDELMNQVEAVRDVANPRETILVVDGLTGQDAVNTAQNFDERIGITGVILTRMDGDGRGRCCPINESGHRKTNKVRRLRRENGRSGNL